MYEQLTLGMVHLYSKKPELILQEIFSAFILFNFSQAAAWGSDTAWGCSQYRRRVNFSDAVYLCCQILHGQSLDIAAFLHRTLLPCRPRHHYPRPVIQGNCISTMYVSAR